MQQTRTIGLVGKSPLLMNRFPMEPIEALAKKTAKEQAEIAAYRIPETGELFIPGTAIQRALIGGAQFVKGKGRASLQKTAAACLMVTPEYVGLGTNDYQLDSRPVVVPATRGRVLRHRPRLDSWACEFVLEYDDALLSEAQLREIVEATCTRVGFLDFRPACKGPFGRAMIVKWEA